MDARNADLALSRIAAAIAEPARARILCCLMDGHARTSTELAAVANVSPSTASAHLARLKAEQLLAVLVQGRHRYYKLAGHEIGAALEALLVVAGQPRPEFVPNTPPELRHARTCYDHMAGTLAVGLHDQWLAQGWIAAPGPDGVDYVLTEAGTAGMDQLGIDVQAARLLRRRFACACLDWSERQPHVGGALGAAFLQLTLRRGWVERRLDSRVLLVTRKGEQRFGSMLRQGVEA
jgi:DNA-binding transcriptional ArsR family regulator